MPASFRTVRWIRTINLVLQAVLFLTLFGGLNYVAKNHPSRFDLTSSRSFSLSPETLSYIRNLERPVRVVITTSEEETNAEVFGLVSELVHATEGRPGQIVSETLDIYRDRRRSEQLGIEAAGVVVLFSGEKRRVVRISDLYGMKEGRRSVFRGEQELTSAILDVASIGRKKIYFLVGHSELRLTETLPLRGLSAVR
ncbi:MAG TPA: Gldg family protein, partial [Opitutaceae bacterium]